MTEGAMQSASSKRDASAETGYPHVARWVRDCGWIELGRNDYSRSMVRALDKCLPHDA